MEASEQVLIAGLEQLGFAEPSGLAEGLLRFGSLLLEANRKTNLVGAADADVLVRAHILDSLAPLRGLRLREPVLDVGSGAGLPGLVAALAYPHLRFVLLEPRAKRADFLRTAVAALKLSNVTVQPVTAETAGRGAWRERAGAVLMRAVAKPPRALELGLPFLSRGGRLVVYLGRQSRPEPGEMAIIELLGGRLEEARLVQVPYLDAVRHVWIILKKGHTPPEFPRRSSPGKRALTSLACFT
ncbi:MAG TPA: 16S rRNA (guanine(527)-N(7))-methyltransferase RsmG [Candidatus Tumulicola sp.]|nr:16S rRNA (guanine(527)-N(7))-methyltransferase RsmG [Candidatus Tumulicola sp.]